MKRVFKCALIIAVCLILTAVGASCTKTPDSDGPGYVFETQSSSNKTDENNNPASLDTGSGLSPEDTPSTVQEKPPKTSGSDSIGSADSVDSAAAPSESASAAPVNTPEESAAPNGGSPNGGSLNDAASTGAPASTSVPPLPSAPTESPQPTPAEEQTASPANSSGDTHSVQPENPSASVPPAAAHSPDEPVVLTITGNGVTSESLWTLNELKSMHEGYREFTYSTTNNWPRYGYAATHGISLPFLLMQSNMKSSAAAFKLSAADGYFVIVTLDQVFGASYSYGIHSSEGSSGAKAVEPVIAWEWGEGSGGTVAVREEKLRSFFGQKGPHEVNSSVFVTDICKIEVLTDIPGAWDAPGASVADGAVVPAGSLLDFSHDKMDSIKIYYTLDGSEPDYNSAVYNPSTSFFQPQLTVPIILTESVTVKAFAGGYGKDASAVVVFRYIVEN